jgi:dCTP diphosphatase
MEALLISSEDGGHNSRCSSSLKSSSDVDAVGHNQRDGTDSDQQYLIPIQMLRSSVLQLSSLVGQLALLFLKQMPPFDSEHASATPDIGLAMGCIMDEILQVSRLLKLELRTAILAKMDLNAKKYPVELCQVRYLVSVLVDPFHSHRLQRFGCNQ